MELKNTGKLRILCLHGTYNNNRVMQHMLAYYEDIFKDFVEFTYLQAPHEWTTIFDQKIYERFKGDKFYTWIDIVSEQKFNAIITYQQSVNFVVEFLNSNDPFDGILTFSQSHYISRWIFKTSEMEMALTEWQKLPSFLIFISSGIFKSYDPPSLRSNFGVPTLYIYDPKDTVLKSNDWVIKEGDYTEIQHDKNHTIPKLSGEKLQTFIDFLSRQYFTKFGVKIVLTPSIDKNFVIKSSKVSEAATIKYISKL